MFSFPTKVLHLLTCVFSDETFDLWVTRVPHDYVPDARQAIVQALEDGINEPGSMFDASVFNTEEETWDSFVVSDFLLPAFYTK